MGTYKSQYKNKEHIYRASHAQLWSGALLLSVFKPKTAFCHRDYEQHGQTPYVVEGIYTPRRFRQREIKNN